MRYFAFITRDADKRYHATLPDFPGCRAHARSIATLPPAIVKAVEAACGTGLRAARMPAATAATALPVPDHAHDGYWLLVDFATAPRRGSARASARGLAVD